MNIATTHPSDIGETDLLIILSPVSMWYTNGYYITYKCVLVIIDTIMLDLFKIPEDKVFTGAIMVGN